MEGKEISGLKEEEFRRLLREVKAGGDRNAEVLIYGRRFNLMGAEYWTAGFLYQLEEIIGEGAVGIIFNSGLQIGAIYYDIFTELGVKDNTELLGKFLGLLKFCGYGEIEVESSGDSLSIILKNSPDAVEYKNAYKRKGKVCCYLRGIFSGFLSNCFARELTVEETKCIANGDPYCEFTLELE